MVITFTYARNIVKIAAIGLGLAQLTASATNSIVVNGGFENGDFTGWSLSGTTALTSISDGASAQSGRYGVFAGPFGSWGFIHQTLPTVPGKTYELEYWLANFDAGPNGFEVRWDGTVVGASFTNAPFFGYRKFTVGRLAATSTSTTLTFALRHDPSFFALDSVSVVAVDQSTDIAMLTATTPNSKRVDFTYSVNGASISSFHVAVYRSADAQFDANSDVLIGSTTITDVAAGSGSIVGDLVMDLARPYVLIVADPINAVQETNEGNNTVAFRKLALGIVTPGFQLVGNLPSVGGVPGWVNEMADALEQRGFSKTLRFDWSVYSNTVLPGQTTAAANLLVSQIQAAVQQMNPLPTDVIDTHWIGHSRGAVVNGQALDRLSQDGAMPAAMTGGWVKMTMLDPHPAKNGPSGPLCSYDPQSEVAWLLVTGCAEFQAATQDPDAIFPASVMQPEVFFQHTPFHAAPVWERFINLWGVSSILPGSRDWTHAGIGHLEIPDAYRISEIETLPAISGSESGVAVASTSEMGSPRAEEVGQLFPDYVDNAGLAESLTTKLAAARAAVARGNVTAARGALYAFVAELNAQRNSHIKAEAADLLTATANSVLSSLK